MRLLCDLMMFVCVSICEYKIICVSYYVRLCKFVHDDTFFKCLLGKLLRGALMDDSVCQYITSKMWNGMELFSSLEGYTCG